MTVETLPFKSVQVGLVETLEDAFEFKRWLGSVHANNAIAVDTETTGFIPYDNGAAIRLIQFGDTNTGWAIPWDMWKGLALEVMSNWEGEWVFHNAAFDLRWMHHHSSWRAPWHRMNDTMLQAHLDNPNERVGLKPLASRIIHPRADAGEHLLHEAMRVNKWTWATVPIAYNPYWEYAAIDVILTARLHDVFRIRARYPEAYDLEMATRRIACVMEDNGAPIDLDYCNTKYNQLNDYVERSKEWCKTNYGISLGSTIQLARYLEEVLDIHITKRTPKGAPSVDKETLKLLVNNGGDAGALATFVLDVRKADKLAGTYFKNFLEGHHNGVLHPSINTIGARTSRMSIRNPALQTLPKGESTVRNAFIPREGEKLVTSDYSQIEMRLMAHFSGDPALQAAFREADATGGDFFTMMGADIYRDPTFTKGDKRRGLVKNTMYGYAYGAGVKTMARTAGVLEPQMQEVVDAVDTAYPGIRHFIDSTADELTRALGTGEAPKITLPSGRVIPVDEDRLYSGTNYLLQGTAAEVLKRAMVEMSNAGLDDYMLLPVHDEVIFSVPEDLVTDVKKTIHDTMSVIGTFQVDVPADPEGPLERWGQRYEK